VRLFVASIFASLLLLSISCQAKRFLGGILIALGVVWLLPSYSGVGSMRSTKGDKGMP